MSQTWYAVSPWDKSCSFQYDDGVLEPVALHARLNIILHIRPNNILGALDDSRPLM